MSRSSEELRSAYRRAFLGYAQGGDETDLHSAYELGRDAVRGQLNVLELARIHHEVLSSALLLASTETEIEQLTRAAGDFLSEALSAFEMVRRGYEEVRETAVVEKQHAEQLHQLSETFIEINSTRSAKSLLQNTIESAIDIIDAECCVATICAGNGASDAVWIATASGSQHAWDEFVHSSDGAELTALVSDPGSPTSGGVSHRPRQLRLRLKRGHTAWLGVALVSGEGRSLGSLQLFDASREGFSESDQSILVQLAQMTAVALDSAQLYEREHRTAVTLQRALLPDRLPQPTCATVAARYMPGEAGVNVGGDWYDIAELPGNRIVVAMGDVVGRGARAAAVMGRVRTAWRAYALRDDPPEAVMDNLNALIEDLDPDHFSTMVHVIVDCDGNQLKIVNAGHPPPLLIAPDGHTKYLQEGLSVPLGVLSVPGYQAETVQLQAGSVLVLYTDGLIERTEATLEEGLRRLQANTEGPELDVELLCDRILERMLSEEAADDVALLAVRFESVGSQ